MLMKLFLSALQYAVETRRPGLVKLLLSSGASINHHLLHQAIKMSGYISGQEIAFLLIRHGVDVTQKDKEGRSPLDWSVYVNNPELVEELLRVGATPASVSSKLLETASRDIKKRLESAKSAPQRLHQLSKKCIRLAILHNHSDMSFHEKLLSLPLPLKIIDEIL